MRSTSTTRSRRCSRRSRCERSSISAPGVFSHRTRDELAAYLDEIRAGASDEHVAAVRDVYGESYLEPASTIFATGD